MATARDYFRHAERALAAVHEDSEASHGLLLEAIANGILAVGMGLGVHLEPLPSLDHYCLCPLTTPVEAFTHAADCPHSKKSPTVASAEDS